MAAQTWEMPKTDWESSDKYNFGDLDRVEINTGYLAAELTKFNGRPVVVTIFSGRDRKQIEFFDSLNRVEGNIQILADNFYEPAGWIKPKTTWASGQRFDWRDAQRLERNLQLIYDVLSQVIGALRYCGTFACGEEVL